MKVPRISGAAARTGGLLAICGLAVLGAPWWGRRTLAAMTFFRVRAIEVDGAQYLSPGDVVARLRVDTTASVWDDLRPLETRLMGLTEVRSVGIGRKLPGTLVVRLTERTPIALGPTPAGLRVFDAAGTQLPIDPTRVDIDLPVVTVSDPRILRLLGALHDRVPALYARISVARRSADGDLLFTLPDARVRAPGNVGADRLAEVLPVTADLARRHAGVAELDLRYRDQVVARLP